MKAERQMSGGFFSKYFMLAEIFRAKASSNRKVVVFYPER